MRIRSYFAVLSVLACAFSSVEASNIVWNTPQQIINENDVSLNGTADRAYLFDNSGPASVIRGVTFTEFVDQTNDLSTFTWMGSGVFSSTQAPYINSGITYRSLLGSGFYNLSASTSANLTINALIPGDTYEVQVWVNDSRAVSRAESINGSAVLSYNTTGVDGGLGQYIIGTFTADNSGSTVLTFSPNAGIPAQINGFQLRNLSTVPEPSTYALGLIGTGVMAAIARRRKARKG